MSVSGNAAAASSPAINGFDATGIGLSSLCLLHCLALPLIAVAAPAAGAWAEAEWIHKVLVLAALPISGYAVLRRVFDPGGVVFFIAAVAGLSLLVAAAFVEAFHDLEKPVTVAGALLLAGAHLYWWRRHKFAREQRAKGDLD